MDGACIIPYRIHTSYTGAATWWSVTVLFRYICNPCRLNAGFRNTKILYHRSYEDVMQHRLALSYWRFGRTCLLHLQGSNSAGRRPIKMETIGYSEKSATHRHFTLRNNPEEWRSHLHRCGSLKSRTPRLNPNAQLLLSWRHVSYRFDIKLYTSYQLNVQISLFI